MLYIYCEGQTEESFVKYILCPYFETKEIFLTPIIHRTKEGPNGRIYKGGITNYNKAVKEIKKLCRQHPNEKITSFIDYYGLDNIPNLNYNGTNKYELIKKIEQKFFNDVESNNFIPYISLHEFESLLFSNPKEFFYLNNEASSKLQSILNEFNNNPEFINNKKETAPSKRIKKEIKNYSKISDGILIAKKIGLSKMRTMCKHFNSWIIALENLN